MQIFDELRKRLKGEPRPDVLTKAIVEARAALASAQELKAKAATARPSLLLDGTAAELAENTAAGEAAGLEVERFECLLPELERRHAEAVDRAKAEADAAEIEACREEVASAEEAVLAAFGGDALEAQIRALAAGFSALGRINTGQNKKRRGTPSFPVEAPPALRAILDIILRDPATA